MKRSPLKKQHIRQVAWLVSGLLLTSTLFTACQAPESTLTFEVVSPDFAANGTVIDAAEVMASEMARSHALGYAFESDGTRLRPTKPADELHDFLAGATRVEAIQNELFATAGKRYIFSDCTVETVFFNDVEFIERIIVTDPAVPTPEGVSVGMTRAAVRKRLGNQYSDEGDSLIYEDASAQLILEFGKNDDLVTIRYVGKFVG